MPTLVRAARPSALWWLPILVVLALAAAPREVGAAPFQARLALRPLAFEPAPSGSEPSGTFVARAPGYLLRLTPGEAVLRRGPSVLRIDVPYTSPFAP